MKSFCRLIFIVAGLFFCTNLFSQDILKRNDVSQVNVDQLSNDDITKLQQQLKANGVTIEQAEQILLSKGMPAGEIAKLKQRLQLLSSVAGKNESADAGKTVSSVESIQTPKNEAKILIDPKIFGSELFTSSSLTFEPNLKIATPLNYELGPDDQLQIIVYGVQEVSHDLTISNEGSIKIPNVGQIKVVGMTVEAATQRIKQAMGSTAYSTLKSGTSKLSVNLGRIRSIHVTVIGSNSPGNYTLSSLSSVFTALYVSGGPGKFGSFREIELVRNNKVERKIDLYRFLLHGDQSDNVSLRDNDVIRIPAYKKRVEIEGQVKRPGIFEVLSGDNFEKLLEYTSGFSDGAYRATVKVTQLTDKEMKVQDLAAAEFGTYQLQTGDHFIVSKLLDRYQNRVSITGAVFRPGYFELTDNMSVADLIKKADGLREDAFSQRAQIIRLKEDLTREAISFNIKNALTGMAEDNVILKKNDEVVITSIQDLVDEYKISIQGEVRMPGAYKYSDSLTLLDFIMQAGGLTDAAIPQKIEIARLIKRDSLTLQDTRASQIININNSSDLSTASKNITLRPFDVITVRRKPGYSALASVTIEGDVQYPGPYVISDRNERVSNIIKRAGGFTPEANIDGAYLKRYIPAETRSAKLDRITKLQKSMHDTTGSVLEDINKEYDQIPLNLKLVVNSPGGNEDLRLEANDILIIPKFNAQVRVSGGVLLPTQIPYYSKHVGDYISAAGGTTQDALMRKLYVVYANGRAKAASNFLMFKSYPNVSPGSEIVIPKKIQGKKMSTGEILGISSALASMAGVVIAILNMSK